MMVQEVERWCISSCQLNPYWSTDQEVIWFCIQCKMWFHFECCTTLPTVSRELAAIGDYLKLPLLKGGCLGRSGTAPLVHAAARLLGSDCNDNLKERLEMELGFTVEEVLPYISGDAGEFINSQISCPACHSS